MTNKVIKKQDEPRILSKEATKMKEKTDNEKHTCLHPRKGILRKLEFISKTDRRNGMKWKRKERKDMTENRWILLLYVATIPIRGKGVRMIPTPVIVNATFL